MLQIFSTQLQGMFQTIKNDEEEVIEDSARALAQAIVADGTIYIHGVGEMAAVTAEAQYGQERLPHCQALMTDNTIAPWTNRDRIILFARFADDGDVVELAKSLQADGAVVIGVSAVRETENPQLNEIADFHIDTKLLQPLVPTESGERIGFPAVMTALYVYYGLYLTTMEIVEEQ
ncbi:DUF2529 domain-containing protein [Desertibacillus haloalkaliphilus]|uniref:DUF2529 domain-containing protein n=1 Tax=Desertibacillus haloalkaliphilus TaxID=1328930 RepID=UPI001C257475|nr:DUF2529 domain-containing protein [Desertibacillus haloalkaliphilus]MBU8905856.1 DUF2529 domain-containing protein [Desertibacillus haloalkaliphilus]